MADQFDSPVDIAAEPAGASGLAYLVTVVGAAVVILVLLNAHALAVWADGLPPGAQTAALSAAAHDLADRTAAWGLDNPRALIKSGWDSAKAANWPGHDTAAAPPQR